jgi:uncharacterized protein YecT (DUF1311 family)
MRQLFLCLILVLPVPSLAEMFEAEYQQCSQSNTNDIVTCVGALADEWDKRLNATYKQLMKDSESGEQTALKAAQRLWIKYRDANCGYYYAGPGTISRIAGAECFRSMTKDRTCELQSVGHGESKAQAECQRP